MKRVFSSNAKTVAKWAERSQDYGRNSRGNIFFEGDMIYSYGRHYPIARFYRNFVLVNSRTYSVTTQQHKRLVYYAVRQDYNITLIPDIDNIDNPLNLQYLKSEYKKFYKLTLRSKRFGRYYYESYIEALNSYRRFCNLLYNKNIPLISGRSDILNELEQRQKDFEADREKRTIDNVLMPKPIFKKIEKKTLKPIDIFKERNAQRRSVLLKIYTYERLLKDSNAKLIHKDGDYELLLVPTPKTKQVTNRFWENGEMKIRTIKLPEDIMLLKVKCPSTGVYYVLRVPPTMTRCKEALAWTFDMTELEYKLEMET